MYHEEKWIKEEFEYLRTMYKELFLKEKE